MGIVISNGQRVISQLPGGQFFCEKKTVKTGIIAIRR